ncbi:PH domain containing protein [Trichomonas vaginalis G3]|uniref:PH domain containing protein n=1 Tax=Trichomonas vaginalis (strain ATCC PRA-98 / G3) TaxID=412133 RepID=A2DSW9_TRIV3|nr:eukaryotic translation initiation factor 3 subunit EIF-3 family [Trichomonas vaginalis G3]EAY16518.1 PH domain containing protein [Trichomonas vaginalis G3]KAI5493579.1 eukaryotic translation initiation factor 3 subunit EIF-3 family [Trichomonas vaginalis G3]|eukprot:XP_001328741.1 PH domain containing protein [Trichomonas vaginalis G3]
MEGYLMKKGWFNQWKMRYVTCSDQKLSIYKNKGDREGSIFNVLNCSIKMIEQKRWNRKFVFRVKIADKRIYLAAEDEITLKKWTNCIQGRAQRASLLGASCIRESLEPKGNAQSDLHKRRSSTIASLSRNDFQNITNFRSEKFAQSYVDASLKREDPQSQFQFAESCGEFLAFAHSASQGIFNTNRIRDIEGYNVKLITDPNERKEKLNQMRALQALVDQNIPGVYVPLQCIIDYYGQTLYFESKVDNPTTALSPNNAELLSSLKLKHSSTKAVQDSKGRLWILSGEGYYNRASKKEVETFVKLLDRMKVFVFDSQSLHEEMSIRRIPVSELPTMSKMTQIPAIRILLETEMIARVCKQIFLEITSSLSPGERNEAALNFFNAVLGKGEESDKMWSERITPGVRAKFGVKLDRSIPFMHMPQLFFSLQFHTGVDFKDTDSYNFNQKSPLSVDDLNSLNAVPHHRLVQLCYIMRGLNKNPVSLCQEGFYDEAMLDFNNKISVYQSIFGDENIFVASGLSLLSAAYLGTGDVEKAEICANGALNAGRNIHCALVPAYITLISTALGIEQINQYMARAKQLVTFQLGDKHWFIADILIAAAQAFQNLDKNKEAMTLIEEAMELCKSLLGVSHPKTSKTFLIMGKLQTTLRQYGQAESLVQQALYSIKAEYGDSSVEYGECVYMYADVLNDEGKIDEALPYAKKAYEIRSQAYEEESAQVIESIQQLAVIYDQLNEADEAYVYYRKLLEFLKRLEDEPIFEETVRVFRNVICLFFRTIGGKQRQLVNQIRRRNVPKLEEMMLSVFTQLIEGDPITFAQEQVEKYNRTAETINFDNLAILYHIATDDLESLKWLDEH